MNYGQSKFASFIEACANTAVGLIFSYTIQIVLIRAYGVEMSNTTAAHFVFWFTIASVFRSYVIRRIGNLPYWARMRERRRKAKDLNERKKVYEKMMYTETRVNGVKSIINEERIN